MRVRTFVLTFMFFAPALAHAQAPDTAVAEPRRNVFSIQPWSANAPGPRLELERAVSRRVSVVAGSRLTLRNPAFAGRSPVFSELDLGVRYYGGGRAFRGPFAGFYAGYDRALRGYASDARYQVPRAFLGATVGHDFVFFQRLLVGPALAIEYGRPDPVRNVRTWQLAPRIGFGLNFD